MQDPAIRRPEGRRPARAPAPAQLGGLLVALLSPLALAACTVEGTALSTASSTALMAAQERGFQGAMQDTRIRVDINHLWFQASEDLFRSVKLQVQRGRVLVTGNVKDSETRLTAVRLAWQVNGVREVIDEIEVNDKSSVLNYARDQWIITELETVLLVDRDIASINYSVMSVNQVVYLMGLSRSQQELDRVIGHAKDISYVRGVVSYVEPAALPSGPLEFKEPPPETTQSTTTRPPAPEWPLPERPLPERPSSEPTGQGTAG